MREYEIKISLNELKQIHKIFLIFSSCQEFIDYIKALIENKKISIKKENEKQMTIELMVEYLYKQNIIKIDLFQKAINFELIAHDLYKKISVLNQNLKNLENNYKIISEANAKTTEENRKINEENKSIKEENKLLKNENVIIKNRINDLDNLIISLQREISEIKLTKTINKINNKIDNNSLYNPIDSNIMTKEEFYMISSEIKLRMNKEVKNIKKLYQATRDGGGIKIFHEKCDNKMYTLVLYKSEANRRFGGFNSECWTSKSETKIDKNCFVFSLDKKKIYPPKNDNYYNIECYPNVSPCFISGSFYIIKTRDNPLKFKTLFTYEKMHDIIFDNQVYALSEDGYCNGIKAKEYEVFQIIF